MLDKKYVVQKSFRVDAKLERDLEQLSVKLNRPQNELVNFALEMLMQDNRLWFAENMLVEYFQPYFENGQQINHYENEIIVIDIIINNDYKTVFSYLNKHTGEKMHETYNDTEEDMGKLKDMLCRISMNLLANDMQKRELYLQWRLNYR